MEHQSSVNSEQQKPPPYEEAAEVVANGGEHGVDGIAADMGEVIAAHAMVLLEMADHGRDGGASFELALDLRREAPLLATLTTLPCWPCPFVK
jgi:hypothetical protein